MDEGLTGHANGAGTVRRHSQCGIISAYTKIQKEKHMNDQEKFYDRCAQILNTSHKYRSPVSRRTRWNNRIVGNGRFPGFGTISDHGSCIRIISKRGTTVHNTYEDVYTFLKAL